MTVRNEHNLGYNSAMEDSLVSPDFVLNLTTRILPSLADILVRYNLTTHFNIFLPHRHFSLAKNERVVRLPTDTADTSVFSVFKDNSPDPAIVEDYNLSIPEVPAVVPFRFLVGDNLVPFEYACLDRESAQGIHFEDVTPEFFAEWAANLHDNSVECPLGLSLRSDNGNTNRRCDAARRVDVEMPVEESDGPEVFPSEWSIEAGSEGIHRIVKKSGCVG